VKPVAFLQLVDNRSSRYLIIAMLSHVFFPSAGGSHFEGDSGSAAGLAAEGEMFPYVSFTLSID
jgi:hypothetical protein